VGILETQRNPEKPKKAQDDNDTDNDTKTYSENKELNSAISEWIEYKKERKEQYKPTGLKSFITQYHNYTPDSVIEAINRSMSN
jgi:hypothetical protein